MRIVAHFDMDAFFAAIEERDKPRLEGLPVVVGADPMDGRGRGVVSTANYKAREYGIHSAMPISEAWRLSEIARRKGEPETVFIGVNMGKYAEESEKIMEIIRTHVALVEQASVDEAYADLTPSTLFRVNPESAEGLSFVAGDHSLIRANRRMVDDRYEKARELCKKIKKEVKEKRKLTVSVGVGPNKLIAKIASGMNKPDGLTIVREEEAEAFLEPMHIRKIPGIGPKTEEMFLKLGVKLV
ncbi:MAG: DNA polymerase IV, partial [Candidatus Colwellbacteria bacterium]|nr:DNA polymerase IV [Candidatus Colwellbacteria bacterium]